MQPINDTPDAGALYSRLLDMTTEAGRLASLALLLDGALVDLRTNDDRHGALVSVCDELAERLADLAGEIDQATADASDVAREQEALHQALSGKDRARFSAPTGAA